ncbi:MULTISPECIES: DMT family transporter [Dethiosulfovibrio]|uniref:SMR family transporter n=2 Tax=Dethiosulfovibrio TaxID=47054 RepID=A0ABS9EQP9_9BACT|nr:MULTISPECIES: SMR family transporter [Dethiosulfovibrio]MCF4114617.1 SMR family transporter [Dethiosulfovibrio russensis]MCF4142841.1 SMR family transporter [Dethiosulfovibrio marinus]MCF4144830.1 SMR family transporter [Dethiosulfovibrio acidaminovorans]
MDRLGFVLILGSALTNAAGSSMMKAGFGRRGDLMDYGALRALIQIVSNPWAIAGVLLFGVSFIFMSAALSRVDLSVAYPMMSAMVYVLVLAVSVFWFGESMGVSKLLGIGAILFGVAALSVGG